MKHAVATLALCLAWATAADAAASTVVIVREPRTDARLREAVTRLSAELTLAGFEIVVVDASPGGDPREQVEGAAPQARPFATVAIFRTKHRTMADVWVVDHLTGKTLIKRIDTESAPEAEAPTVLALRAVDLLRASLLEASAAPPKGGDPPQALPSDVARWVARGRPRGAREPPKLQASAVLREAASPAPTPKPRAPVHAKPRAEADQHAPGARTSLSPSFGADIAALYSAGALGFGFAPRLRVGYGQREGFMGRLSLLGPSRFKDLSGTAGDASMSQYALSLEAVYLVPNTTRFAPLVSLGAGVHETLVEGTPKPGFIGHRSARWGALFEVGGGIRARVTEQLSANAELSLFFVEPQPIVAIGGGEAGRLARPFVALSLGVVATP